MRFTSDLMVLFRCIFRTPVSRGNVILWRHFLTVVKVNDDLCTLFALSHAVLPSEISLSFGTRRAQGRIATRISRIVISTWWYSFFNTHSRVSLKDPFSFFFLYITHNWCRIMHPTHTRTRLNYYTFDVIKYIVYMCVCARVK